MLEHKNLVIDTSALIEYPQILHKMPNKNIFLTLEILEELDKHKVRKDNVGRSARYVNKFLDQIRKDHSLVDGAELENGAVVYVINGKGFLADGLEEPSNDNKIISVAFKLKAQLGDVAVISNDIALRVKCDSIGVASHTYSEEKKQRENINKFTGVREVEVMKEDIDFLYDEGKLMLMQETFIKNECIILKSDQSSALAVAIDENVVKKLHYTTTKNFSAEGIKPRSAEQTFALEMLLDPKISLLTLTGLAGSGKTLMTIAAALHHLHHKNYDRIIISRPVESSSKDIGFLPGDKNEKMAPWVQPIFDNITALYGERGKFYIEQLMGKGQLEVEAMTYIRGRSLPRTIFIIDEAQNISYDEAKALITRMGEGSKIILTGDLEQIDSVKLNETTSGLAGTIEVFKKFEGAAHITLRRGERSALATFAAENM